PIMKGFNNCAWLKVGELRTCGKSCIMTYCKVHLAKIRKGKKIPTPCRKYGKGVQSEIEICRACGLDKYATGTKSWRRRPGDSSY
ncbi:MAG: hypothetical protein AB2556_25450, partial [Candidatus Thiodiazotropha sp.]